MIMKKNEYFLITILVILILSFFYNKGFSTGDEGYILHAAQRLHNGELPYKDFNFIYTPASLFVISATYVFFGESILSGKLLVVFIAIITSLFIYLVTHRLVKNRLIAVLSVLVYLAWAPSHINFPLPVIFCLLTGTISLFIFIKLLENPKKLYYFTLGLSVFLTFFFKQNFGLALFFEYTLLFLVFKKLRKKSILYFLSFLLCLVIFYLYLFFTQSIYSFFYYSNYAFQEYFIRNMVVAPFPLDSSIPILSLLKIFLYLSPLVMSALVILYCLHKKNTIEFIAGALFVGFYYLAGIYPSTDYVHISPLLSLLGLPLAFLINVKYFKLTILVYILFLCVIIGGFYTALFKGFYRWNAPIVQQKYYLNHPRMMVWSDNKDLVTLVSYIQNNTSRNDYIYFYLYEPMFYFISDRKNPVKYLDSFLPDEKLQSEYINSITNRNTKLIISAAPVNTWFKSPLSAYILNNYTASSTISAYTVWKRKK